MNNLSVLFVRPQDALGVDTAQEPDFFTDLNLDQVVTALTRGRSEYDLTPFFYTPLHDVDAILYRQEILKDLENPDLLSLIQVFGKNLHVMREQVEGAQKRYYPYQAAAWFRDAVQTYCTAVEELGSGLMEVSLASRGLTRFKDYLNDYRQSRVFQELHLDTERLRQELASIGYQLHLKGLRVEVYPASDSQNYSTEIKDLFRKFQSPSSKQYQTKFSHAPDMNHVEAEVLELVAKWNSGIFSHLHTYYSDRNEYLDPTVARFDREIQFYLAVRDYVDSFGGGHAFCYPQLSMTGHNLYAEMGFDLALAEKLREEKRPPVCNDFRLEDSERILVISGPNQGGKTTFARMFGQVHYLASLGSLVPARSARLLVWDQLFTHFERREDLETLRGKLQDDLKRIHDILQAATAHSIIIMNEIFTSTALFDAIFLSRKIMEQIMECDALALCVTFIGELASLSEKTVSMVAVISSDDQHTRTYKVVRSPQDGASYALSVADKYQVTYEHLKERIK